MLYAQLEISHSESYFPEKIPAIWYTYSVQCIFDCDVIHHTDNMSLEYLLLQHIIILFLNCTHTHKGYIHRIHTIVQLVISQLQLSRLTGMQLVIAISKRTCSTQVLENYTVHVNSLEGTMHVPNQWSIPEKSTMCVGTFSGVTSPGIVISSALGGTWGTLCLGCDTSNITLSYH